MTDATQLLTEAADILVTGGWTQHSWENADGQHCMIGALDAAFESHFPSDDEQRAQERLWITARDRLNAVIDGGSAMRWNDEPGRTAEEVVAVLRKAAEDV